METLSETVGDTCQSLYSQRHSFLSHALAMGNTSADLASVAGLSVDH